MIKEQKVTYKLTVTAYYDGELDIEELRQKLLETLKNDNWDCSLDAASYEPPPLELLAPIAFSNRKTNKRGDK